MRQAFPNIVLVTIDCLRADYVGYMGRKPSVTPNLDVLASNGIVFTHAYAAGIPTYYSFPGIFASRYPLSFGRDIVGLSEGTPTIASVLREHGYDTVGLNAGNPYLTSRYHYNHGFEHWQDFMLDNSGISSPSSNESNGSRLKPILRNFAAALPMTRWLYDELGSLYAARITWNKFKKNPAQLYRYPPASKLTRTALDSLSNQKAGPFFLWLHYMDAHNPRFVLNPDVQRRLSVSKQIWLNGIWQSKRRSLSAKKRHVQDLQAVYAAALAEIDNHVGTLVRHIQQRKLQRPTVFIVLGDHGEEFLEHGHFDHHPFHLSDELTHVPLIFSLPEIRERRQVDSFISLLDIAPTLLGYLGIETPKTFQGKNYWHLLQNQQTWDEPVVVEAVKETGAPVDASNPGGYRLLSVRDSHAKLDFDAELGQIEFEEFPAQTRRIPTRNDKTSIGKAKLVKRLYRHIVESHQGLNSMESFTMRLARVKQKLEKQRSELAMNSIESGDA